MKRTPLRKKSKKTEKQKAKEKAWKYCSIYNRMKDADWRGYVSCVTCGATKHWKEMQAGHFIPGRTNGILFEDNGIHAQDYRCNIALGSNPRKYDAYMKKRYGQKEINRLDKLSETSVQYTTEDYLRIAEEYKDKINKLNK